MTSLETVRAYYSLFEHPVREVLDRVVADDFVLDDNPIDWHLRGKAEVWRTVERLRPEAASADQGSFVVQDYIGDNERGAARWHWRATGRTASLFGLPHSDGVAEIDGVAIVEFRDGRLTKLTEYWDAAALMRQLGADIPIAHFPTPTT